MFHSILVVCTANICRSPVGEALFKARLPELRIESAGLAPGAHEGSGAAPFAKEFAAESGLDLEAHRSRRITRDMIDAADLILVMSEGQRRHISELAPAATGKTMLYGRWLPDGGSQGCKIPDPYRKSREAFAHVHKLLTQAADAWQTKLGS
ncbi:low molecular weight protein-tyrosine-phosphatase [Halomonas sp. M20]|uniref:low molecular weight protein-tyrosine-phosphatase n=1 Tax=Halomonas sp. M20 TaxID=2763264 RepID=UPI001D0A7335|nr:low molecular weight protein-tyrosine-phosphatase [Halomonas sp. M20]